MNYEFEKVAIRMVKEPPLISDKPITSPEGAVELLSEVLCDLDREVIAIVNLRTDGCPINMNVMSMGTLNYTVATPREALKTSILSNASNIILFHNHPSGNLKPSKEDIQMTDQMIKAYELMGIGVLDHIIIAPDRSFFSMREQSVFEAETDRYSSRVEELVFSVRKQASEARGR